MSTRSSRRLISYALTATLSLALCTAAVWSLSLGYSDVQFQIGTRAAVRRAMLISPGEASYIGQASMLEGPSEARRNLKRAVALDPYYAWAWIQLGLAAESNGDSQNAEKFLNEAAHVDRLFETRWVLSDFYYRQARFDLFWYWVHQALDVDESDSRPVFRLAARVLPDPAALLKRIAPANGRVEGNLVSFLAQERSLEAASVIVQEIPRISVETSPILVQYTDKLLQTGNVDSAIRVWDALIQRGFLPFSVLDPAHGNSLTNPRFLSAPSGHGFDWHADSIEGVANDLSNGQLQATLSGRQPDGCRLLFQTIPVLTNREYKFHFRNRFAAEKPSEGLKWKVYRGLPGEPSSLLAESTDLTNADWREQTVVLRNSHESMLTLSLEYHRPRGAIRLSGVATLDELSLRLGSS